MSHFKHRLHKIVGEIRYKPTLSSWEKSLELAKTLEGDFKHWRIQNEHEYILFDDKKKFLIKINFDSVSFLNEGGDSQTDEMFEKISSVFDRLVTATDISEFRHIGCRTITVVETEFEKQDLTDLTFKKFYASQNTIEEISGSKIMDTLFVINSQKNGFLNRVQMGPTEKNQALTMFGSTPIFHNEDKLSDDKNYFLIDVDVFKKEEFYSGKILSNLKEMIDENKKMSNSYIDYVLNQ